MIEHTKAKIAAETQVQKQNRQDRDKASKAAKRAFEKTVDSKKKAEQTSGQTHNLKSITVKKRTPDTSIEKAISNFHSQSKFGPEFICTCCHRMMYKQSVVCCNPTKYSKTSTSVLDQVFCGQHSYISHDGNQWMCKTCDRALTRGNMPLQAKANGLQLCPVPDELSCLNLLELRLISLRKDIDVLPEYERVTVEVKVVQVGEVCVVGIAGKRVQECTVADSSTSKKLTIWEEDVCTLKQGVSYRLCNFMV